MILPAIGAAPQPELMIDRSGGTTPAFLAAPNPGTTSLFGTENITGVEAPTANVPEPDTLALLGTAVSALALVVLIRRRRRRK